MPVSLIRVPGDNRRYVQQTFMRISQDGVMGMLEWKRCMAAAGIVNEFVSERLFDMFDTSGDKEMNAKEFSSGLSDICNDRDPTVSPASGGWSRERERQSVRQLFAFRYYDTSGEGLLQQAEFSAFLATYVRASRQEIKVR